MSQVTISTIKSDLAIYFILGQVIPALNSPKDIDSYQCKQNETKIIVPLYDVSTGKFLGLDLQLGYIVLRGDPDELFFSYGFNAETLKVLFCSSKERIPNAFKCTAFKKHYKMIVDERYTNVRHLFYLPSTTDRKELMYQYKDNVSLNPIDWNYEDFKNFSSEKKDFYPHYLDLNVNDERKVAAEILYNIFNDLVEMSNANLIRNADHLLAILPGASVEVV